MRARIAAALGVIACAVLLLTGACSRRPERVVVGIGLTANAHPAIQLATREINAAGGIDGVPLEVVGTDWKGFQTPFDPESVIRLADRFVTTENLLGVIGHSDSASTLSAAAAYNKHGVPQIVTIATNPAITNVGQWTYRLCLSDAAQGPALADYAVRTWNKRRIAIFYVNDDYGRGLAERFEARVRALNGTVVTAVMHRNILTTDDEDMIRSTLAGLKAEAPDLVVLFQRNDAAEWTLQAMEKAGLRVDVLGGDNLAQHAFINSGPASKEGIRVSQFYNPDSDDERARRFARDIQAATGAPPDYAKAFAYDALYLFRDAVRAGGFSRAGVKAYLDELVSRKTPVKGVGGPFTLGNDHDARRSLYIAEIRERRFKILQPLPTE